VHRYVPFGLGQKPQQTRVLNREIFEPFDLIARHSTVLFPVQGEGGLVHFHHLRDLGAALAAGEHRVGVKQFFDALVSEMSITPFFIRASPCPPFQASDLRSTWTRFSGAIRMDIEAQAGPMLAV